MIYTGLVSVTFRKLEPIEIIRLVREAGLDGIEWGGDIHVPHGDTKKAAEVYNLTIDNGLRVASYGSYYRTGRTDQIAFESVLETAVALHAPTIRLWAGDKASEDADAAYREMIAADTRRVAELASANGITVSFEYHQNTLNDTPESAVRFMKEINHHNVRSYWQSEGTEDRRECLEGLNNLLSWVSNVHVSCADVKLANVRNIWSEYIDALKKSRTDRFCMIEFVKGDSREQFLRDAKVLKSLLEQP